jgi:hypothetical protein
MQLYTIALKIQSDLNITVAWYMTLAVVHPDGSEQRILNLYGCKGGHWLQVTKITKQTSTYFKQVQVPNWNYRPISMHFDMTFPRASPALPKGHPTSASDAPASTPSSTNGYNSMVLKTTSWNITPATIATSIRTN